MQEIEKQSEEFIKNTAKNRYLTYLTVAHSCYGSPDPDTFKKYVEFYSIGLKLKKEYEEKYENKSKD